MLARFAVVLVLFGGVVLADEPAPAPAPAAHDGDGITEAKLWQRWRDYEAQVMIDGYRRSEYADPKWDDKVENLFRGVAGRYAWRYGANAEQEKLAAEIVALGCRDPLVGAIVLSGRWQNDGQSRMKLARSVEEGEALLKACEKAGYGKIRLWRLTAFVAGLKRSFGEDRSELTRWDGLVEDALVAAASEPGLTPETERLIYDKALGDFDANRGFYSRALLDKLEKSAASAWLKGVLAGEWHMKEAWERRGSEYSYKVTDAGWHGFENELKDAHECLVGAYKADPTRPEPATVLISVLGGLGSVPGESEKFWFEKATAAQFDYAHAYVARRWFLRPRWGGSHKEMMAEAERWADCGRFDTRVPEMFLWTVDDICDDRGEYRTIWNEPGVMGRIAQIRDGYMKSDVQARNLILSRIAFIFWQAGRPAEAKDVIDSLGDLFQTGAGSTLRVQPNEIRPAHAYAPALRERVLRADALVKEGDFDGGAAVLQAVLDDPDTTEDRAKDALRMKIAETGFRKDLSTGGWASLLLGKDPAAFFDAGPSPEAWSITPESLRLVKPARWWGQALFLPRVGTRYEMRSRVVVPADASSPKCEAGFLVRYSTGTKSPYWQIVVASPAQESWCTGSRWDRDNPKPAEIGEKFDLDVKLWDDEIVIRLDGKTVYAGPAARADDPIPFPDQVLLCVTDRSPAAAPVEFQEPKIRMLKERPEELDANPRAKNGPAKEPKARF